MSYVGFEKTKQDLYCYSFTAPWLILIASHVERNQIDFCYNLDGIMGVKTVDRFEINRLYLKWDEYWYW